MIPLERGLMDEVRPARRTWPGSPVKHTTHGADTDAMPRLQTALQTSHEAGYGEGERDGYRTGYWQGWISGMFMGAVTAGLVIATWLGYAQ